MPKLKNKAIAAIVALVVGAALAPVAANATTPVLAVGGTTVTTGNTAANAVALPVPADAVLAANALNVSVSGLAAGATVSAVATNALLLTTLTGATAASGSDAVSVNASNSGSVELFVFTKTTTVGTVVVTVGNVSTTYYVKGLAGDVARVALSGPTSGLVGSTQSVVVSAFDKYENAKGSGTVSLIVNVNGVITTGAIATGATGTASYVVTMPSTGSVVVTGFAASSSSVVTIAVTQPRNLEAELAVALATIASLSAEIEAAKKVKAADDAKIASLSAEAATYLASTTFFKREYNKLVWKWNKQNPKARLKFVK